MKNNSVRLRVTQTELARFADVGRIEETIEFGLAANQHFAYALIAETEIETVRATFENNRITISIPKSQADEWTQTACIGIAAEQIISNEKTLRLLIEKDFACLEPRAGDDDSDAFPNPLTLNEQR